MKKRLWNRGFTQVISASLLLSLVTWSAQADSSQGQDYIVKSGDGLYKLGRVFYNNGADYKKIVKAHNAKAQVDSRYKTIDPDQGLTVGQLIWIPIKQAKPEQQPQTLDKGSLARDLSLPEPKKTTDTSKPAAKKDEPAYIVTLPSSNCEIQIWYNFQLVAIKKINQRWKAMGMSLIDRAKKAHQMRHDARLNGRFMMKDRFEVAALKDRDQKKYGNPDGPTFEHMVAFGRENGLTGDSVYEGIIESSSHVQPVYKSTCAKR